MLRGSLLALVAVVSIPAAGRADGPAALYPDAATFAFGMDVKAIMTSPLGRKVIGDDKPFAAMRKLLTTLFPEDIFRLTDKSLEPLGAVANRLERVTVVGDLNFRTGQPPMVALLKGEIGEDEYFKAAEAIARAENKEFSTEKMGDRKLFVVGKDHSPLYGLSVNKSLFLVATDRKLIDEVLDKHAGKRKTTTQKELADQLKKVKPAETPIWLVVGRMELLSDISGGIATIALKDDAEFRMEVACDKDETAKSIANILKSGVDYLARAKTPQGKLWDAAGLSVRWDGDSVRVTGKIPGKLLVEEYARQK